MGVSGFDAEAVNASVGEGEGGFFTTLNPHCRHNLVVGLRCVLHLTQDRGDEEEDTAARAAAGNDWEAELGLSVGRVEEEKGRLVGCGVLLGEG